VSTPTARQRRILSGLVRGDPVFEVPQKSYFTQFDESTSRQRRISLKDLTGIEEHGWAWRVSTGAQECDHWEITDLGREALLGGKAESHT
jgi:hypothetical protein